MTLVLQSLLDSVAVNVQAEVEHDVLSAPYPRQTHMQRIIGRGCHPIVSVPAMGVYHHQLPRC